MTEKKSPFVDASYGWDFGESGWNAGADSNWLKFSFFFDKNIDGIVDTLPQPVNGKAYYLTSDNRVYFVVDGIYRSSVIPLHFEFVDRVTHYRYQFDGNGLSTLLPIQEVDSAVNSLGTASTKNIEDFATPQSVSQVETASKEYTDSLRDDLLSTLPNKGVSLVTGSARFVDTYTDLTNLTSYTLPVFTLGYHVVGDGGAAGPYIWDATSTAVPNGGTVVVGASLTGRWLLNHNGTLNVKQFGAKGDNVNDDSIPAQACIDAVIALGGGTIIFPSGTYNFQSKRPAGLTPKAFEDPNLFIKDADNVHFIGTGDSILTNSIYPNNRAEIMLFYRCRNCSVRGITFQGNNVGLPNEVNNCAIGMLSNQQMAIRDNIMRGFQGSYIASSWLFDSEISGNVFEVLGGSGIDCAFWQDVRVLGNTFKGNGLGNNGLGTQGMQCAHDTPNVDNNETGVFFRLYSNHVTVNENLFTGFTTGLYLADMVDARVEDNDFHNNYLETANQSWGCVISNTISNFAMRGIRLAENTFSNNGSPDGGGGLTLSVGTATTAEVEINENDFYDNRAIGLQINTGVVLRGRNNTFGNRLTAQQTTNVTGALSAGVGSLFVDNPGFNPVPAFGPSLPAGLGIANAVTNNRPYPATIYQNGGVGIHIVMPNGTDVTLFPGDSKIIRLPAYAKIYFATTNTTGWTWVFE